MTASVNLESRSCRKSRLSVLKVLMEGQHLEVKIVDLRTKMLT